ncbi:MAG: GNAT family N-acetyltransferase [Rhodospirillaceae bacterium]|nr:GNAT family N-acetyltransferase [Rhodospirillales bacterium]
MPVIWEMLTELAAFEGGVVSATQADLARDGFGDRPLFEALLAEVDGQSVGLLVFIPLYSSWQGRKAVMIHDLYVREAARGHGAGKALVTEVTRLALVRGCCRVEVNVLEWNAKARAFYEGLGLRHNEGWLGCRSGVLG